MREGGAGTATARTPVGPVTTRTSFPVRRSTLTVATLPAFDEGANSDEGALSSAASMGEAASMAIPNKQQIYTLLFNFTSLVPCKPTVNIFSWKPLGQVALCQAGP